MVTYWLVGEEPALRAARFYTHQNDHYHHIYENDHYQNDHHIYQNGHDHHIYEGGPNVFEESQTNLPHLPSFVLSPPLRQCAGCNSGSPTPSTGSYWGTLLEDHPPTTTLVARTRLPSRHCLLIFAPNILNSVAVMYRLID